MDRWFLDLANQTWIHPVLDLIMVAITVVLPLVLPLLGWMLIRRQRQQVGWTLLLALLASSLFTLLFYYLALRPRPTDVRLLLPTPPFPSYPSGHTATAFAAAVVLALSLRRHWVTVCVLGGALLVGYSRLYLGHHYPSDVIGGTVAGVAIGASVYGLRQAGSLVARLRWLLWPQIAVVLVVTQMAYLDLNPKWLLAWPYSDKVLHALLFGAVVFWLNLWFTDRRIDYRGWSAPLAIVIPFTLAFLEEGAQSFSPIRTTDITDLASDLVGMVGCWWLSSQLLRRGDKEIG
jgi:membrane-associated phospholipid phosphatase